MHPTLGRDQAVQFVDDHPLDARDDGLEPRGTDGNGHALGGGDEDVRWFPQHLLAVRLRGVASAQAHADFFRAVRQIARFDFFKRAEQVPLDVVRQGLDR